MTLNDQTPFPEILEALFGNENVPVHLIYRLSDMSPDEHKLFQREWSEVSEDRRAAIARHMADIAEEDYLVDFSPVFGWLFGDRYPAVRQAALDGIWDSTESSLVPPVIRLLQNDPSVAVRTAAARALAHYVLMAEWGEVDESVEVPIVEALLGEIQRPMAAPEVKRAALEAVASAGDPRIADLIRDAYEDGSNEMQLSAIFAMGVSADPRWLGILDDEMTSPSADFRAEAARAAGSIGNSESIDSLEQLLTDEETEVATAAVYALGQIGGDRAGHLLQRIAEDPDFEELYDAIDEALEELEWTDGAFDLLSFPELEDDDEDDLADLRAN